MLISKTFFQHKLFYIQYECIKYLALNLIEHVIMGHYVGSVMHKQYLKN